VLASNSSSIHQQVHLNPLRLDFSIAELMTEGDMSPHNHPVHSCLKLGDYCTFQYSGSIILAPKGSLTVEGNVKKAL